MANVFYGAGRSPKRQKYVQLLSRVACGRCNRYCPTDDMVSNFCCLLNLVNKSVSRETIFCNATSSGDVCCLPSFSRHPLVSLLHFGLRPVQQDRLRICPLQCRQWQQNISLTCAHKAGLSFAKIPNWDGQQRRLFYPSWTQSMARKIIKLMSSTTEGWAKIGQADHVIFHTKQFYLRYSTIGKLFVACPPSSNSFTAVPLSRTTSATVETAGQTVRFNVDNGNKTSP